jgi:hypothetical protein
MKKRAHQSVKKLAHSMSFASLADLPAAAIGTTANLHPVITASHDGHSDILASSSYFYLLESDYGGDCFVF